MKATHPNRVKRFIDIPNVGPAMVKDFILIGIRAPEDLKGADAYDMYQKLCTATQVRHDPCVLDTFLAVVDFMNGGKPQAWWMFTEKRKKLHPKV